MDTVSVIIPTFNRAAILGRALESVYAQTRPPHEVLVVDDGSTDDTAGRVARDWPRVRYHPRPHAGVSAARNFGIRKATGTWIALLDSDDQWLPHKLEKQLACIRRDPGARLIHSDEIWIRNGRRVNPMARHAKSGGRIFERCLPLCCISPSAALIHRSVFEHVGLFDESLPACEDYDLWLRVCARHEVHYIDEPLVIKHGGHADQLSRRYWGMDRFRIQALHRLLDSGILDREQRRAALAVLEKKIRIYSNGAEKRRRFEEAARYRSLLAHHSGDPSA